MTASPLAVGLLLVLLPVGMAFLVSTHSFLNERPRLRALAAPAGYYFGIFAGVTLGVNLGIFLS